MEIKDINQAKDYFKKKYNELLELEKKRIYPNIKFITEFYNVVTFFSDLGDHEGSFSYNYHSLLIQDCIKKSINILNKNPQIDFINSFCMQLDKINFVIYILYKGFMYLDRFYTPGKILIRLVQKSFKIFKNEFFLPLKGNLFKALTNYFIEINNKDDTEENIKNIKKIFNLMNYIDISNPKIIKKNNEMEWINENREETSFEEKSKTFNEWFNNNFLKEYNFIISNKMKEIKDLPISEYIPSILNLKFQPIILKKYFDSTIYNIIYDIYHKNLIKNNIENMENYFFNLNKEKLKNFYQLNKNSKSCILLICESFIYSVGKRDMKMFENKGIKIDNNKCIPIEIKKEIQKLFSECFDNNILEYQIYMNRIIKMILNKSSYSKQLAIYINCMRKNFKGKSEEEIKDELNEIIETFILLNNKCDLKIYLEKQMSERLIKNTSLSINTEKKFITMIKQEIGVNYANNMVEMIKDLDKSFQEKEVYNKLKDKSIPNDIKIDIKVLTYHCWNINKKYLEKIKLSPFLSFIVDDYEKKYIQRHYYQKLFWYHGLSKVTIEYLCYKKNDKNNNHISISTLIQYLILLQIEKYQKLSLEKIAENIGCKVDLILEDISGLIFNPSFNPHHKKDKGILLGNFEDNKNEFNPNDEVWFNKDFNCSTFRFNTMSLPMKKNEKEIKKDEEDDEKIIKKYQENILQSTITRIMKSQNGKKVPHIWLIDEVSKQVTYFNAQPQQIKENIEKIIEKNIIKRDEKDSSCYQYIA